MHKSLGVCSIFPSNSDSLLPSLGSKKRKNLKANIEMCLATKLQTNEELILKFPNSSYNLSLLALSTVSPYTVNFALECKYAIRWA